LKTLDDIVDAVLPQPFELRLTPFFGLLAPFAVERSRDGADMLMGVIPVKDFHAFRKMLGRKIPDPRRPVSQDDDFSFDRAGSFRARPKLGAEIARTPTNRNGLPRYCAIWASSAVRDTSSH
jgi:hypothetical protein